MIVSIGTDIIEIEKIKRYSQRQYFLDKVFTPKEIDYAKNKRNLVPHLATTFAAKEAIFKALGIGWIDGKEIEVVRTKDGQPKVIISGASKKFLGDNEILLSLSYNNLSAIAFAMIKKKKEVTSSTYS